MNSRADNDIATAEAEQTTWTQDELKNKFLACTTIEEENAFFAFLKQENLCTSLIQTSEDLIFIAKNRKNKQEPIISIFDESTRETLLNKAQALINYFKILDINEIDANIKILGETFIVDQLAYINEFKDFLLSLPSNYDSSNFLNNPKAYPLIIKDIRSMNDFYHFLSNLPKNCIPTQNKNFLVILPYLAENLQLKSKSEREKIFTMHDILKIYLVHTIKLVAEENRLDFIQLILPAEELKKLPHHQYWKDLKALFFNQKNQLQKLVYSDEDLEAKPILKAIKKEIQETHWQSSFFDKKSKKSVGSKEISIPESLNVHANIFRQLSTFKVYISPACALKEIQKTGEESFLRYSGMTTYISNSIFGKSKQERYFEKFKDEETFRKSFGKP